MRADGKNMGMWHGALCAVVGASVLLAGCATHEADEDGLREGTFVVTGLELGSCANDSWLEAGTTSTSLVVEASGDAFAVKACSQQDGVLACSPASPSSYAWNVDVWRGDVGGAYIVESGCLLVHVQATARMVGGELTIETTRWASELASGSCTVDEVAAMRERPCDGRSRLYATEQ